MAELQCDPKSPTTLRWALGSRWPAFRCLGDAARKPVGRRGREQAKQGPGTQATGRAGGGEGGGSPGTPEPQYLSTLVLSNARPCEQRRHATTIQSHVRRSPSVEITSDLERGTGSPSTALLLFGLRVHCCRARRRRSSTSVARKEHKSSRPIQAPGGTPASSRCGPLRNWSRSVVALPPSPELRPSKCFTACGSRVIVNGGTPEPLPEGGLTWVTEHDHLVACNTLRE